MNFWPRPSSRLGGPGPRGPGEDPDSPIRPSAEGGAGRDPLKTSPLISSLSRFRSGPSAKFVLSPRRRALSGPSPGAFGPPPVSGAPPLRPNRPTPPAQPPRRAWRADGRDRGRVPSPESLRASKETPLPVRGPARPPGPGGSSLGGEAGAGRPDSLVSNSRGTKRVPTIKRGRAQRGRGSTCCLVNL